MLLWRLNPLRYLFYQRLAKNGKKTIYGEATTYDKLAIAIFTARSKSPCDQLGIFFLQLMRAMLAHEVC